MCSAILSKGAWTGSRSRGESGAGVEIVEGIKSSSQELRMREVGGQEIWSCQKRRYRGPEQGTSLSGPWRRSKRFMEEGQEVRQSWLGELQVGKVKLFPN